MCEQGSDPTIYRVMFCSQQNLTIDSNSSSVAFTPETCVVVILPELFAIGIFSVSIWLIYKGIEIDHPVYAIIFSDLIFSMIASTIIFFASFFIRLRLWTFLGSILNMCCLLFHHSSWATISILRYGLITKPNFVNSIWPDHKNLKSHSLIVVVCVWFFLASGITGYFLHHAISIGWPEKNFFETAPPKLVSKVIAVTATIFYIPVLISLIVYLLLLWTLRKAKVATSLNPDSTNTFGNQFMVNSLEPNAHRSSDSDIDSILEARLRTERHLQKSMEELRSTLRSLNTNLIVILLGMIISSAIKLLPKDYQSVYNLLTNTFQKILYPLATTVANFGKVRSVIQAFYNMFLNKN